MSLGPPSTLPPSIMSFPRRYHSQIIPSRRSFPQLPTRSKTKSAQNFPCCDWIFSSATNIHVAIDRSSFHTFTSFDSYVLTVAGSSPVPVRGIGSVNVKVRCKPTSHQSRTITLENVLYVPTWVCNIISDIYFDTRYDHVWVDNSLLFTRIESKSKSWCYTESFCGLDRLVLSKKMSGRSPMLEDKEREVWSINLNWPQSQRDKWTAFMSQELQRLAKEHEIEILAQQQIKKLTDSAHLLLSKNQGASPNPKLKSASPISPSRVSIRSLGMATRFENMRLDEVNSSIPLKGEGNRVGSSKASFTANRGLLKDFLAAGAKT